MGSYPLRHKVMLPQLKMIVIILMALLTCGGGQQITPPHGNTLILMNVIDILESLSQQLKETQKIIQADIKQVQANVTGIIETQKTIQADIKQVQANVTGIIETQKTIQADIKRLQQCSTKVQLSQFQELVFKDDCVEGSHTCSDMSTCTDYVNRYECSCLPGYSGDGFTCQDVNECRENNNICGDHGTCQNDPGSYTCTCDKYFRNVGNICQAPVCESSPTSLSAPEIGCLTIVKQRMTWDEGTSKCQEMGLGRLAEGIHHRHFQALSDHFGGYWLWVGLRRRQWIHQEEEQQQVIKDEDWVRGEPDGPLKECGYLDLRPSDLGLGDRPCSDSRYLLCQSLP